MAIVVFGDSIGAGYHDMEKAGWVSRLNLFTCFEPTLYNCSIAGSTTDDVLARFDAEIANRPASLIIFALGTNDAARQSGAHLVPHARFIQNIHALTQKAKNIGAQVLWLGLFHADETKTTPVSWDETLHYKNADLTAYDEAIRAHCHEEHSTYVPLMSFIRPSDLFDGIHPNTHGHEILFSHLQKQLDTYAKICKF